MLKTLSSTEVDRRQADMTRVVLACAWSVLVISLLYLAAWWAVAANWMTFGFIVPVPRSSAVLFVFLGAGLAMRQMWPGRRGVETGAMVAGGIVLVAALSAAYGNLIEQTPSWQEWLEGRPVVIAGQTVGHLGLNGTLLFIGGAFSLLVFSPRFQQLVRLRRAAVAVVALITCLCGFNLIAYTAGNPIFTGSQVFSLTLPNSLNFALLNTGLLFSIAPSFWFRKWLFGVDETTALPPLMRDHRRVWRIVGLWIAGILAVIITYVRVHTATQRDRTAEALGTIADLKAGEVVRWRTERFADARTLAHSLTLAPVMQAILAGAEPSGPVEALARWLQEFEQTHGYKRILVLNAALAPLAARWNDPVLSTPALREQLRGLEGGADVIELAPYVDPAGELRWDLLAVIRPEPGGAPLGAILLQTDMARALWPILRSWSADNQTGEFVLWYRSGNRLLSLGGYRLADGAAAPEQRPFAQVRDLTQPGLLMSRVANGERGMVDGRDVRGIPIVGLGRLIPDSNWLLSCRVDAGEVYAPVRKNAWQVVALSAAIFSLVGLTVARSWRDRQRDLLHETMVAELDQKRTAARLGAVLQNARDVIIVLDDQLRIVDVNQQALETYGCSRDEMVGRLVREFRAPEAVGDFAATAQRANAPAGATYETVHRRRDGSTFPVEISSRKFEADGQVQWLSIIRDISERKRAEAELRASEERYRLIAENTSDVIWLYDCATEGFSYVSPSSLALLGYRPEELTSRPLFGLLPPDSLEPARLLFEELVRAAAQREKPRYSVVELNQLRKDGVAVPTEVVASVLVDANHKATHVLGITRDITERRRAREALEKFNTELEQRVVERTAELADRNRDIQTLIDAMPDTVLLCNRQGQILSARSIRYPEVRALVNDEALPGRRPVLDAVLLGMVREMQAEVAGGNRNVLREFERDLEGGQHVFFEARATAIGAERLLVLIRDITDRKQIEQALQSNLEREKQLSEMKSQFVSVASHEFRTPLAAAVGSLELLERHASKITEAKRLELIGRIQRSLARLTTIMNDVLNLSRADSGRVKVARMNADLVRLAQDIVREVETGDRQQHRFVFESTGGPETVPVDTKLTNHILSNLVGNAVRYSPAGTTVTIKLHIDATEFTFSVADEGIGVPEAERDRIFEPFARGSNVGQISGTGLGLNIVKRYTELMGGNIRLLPSARGAIFRVVVPLHPSSS